MASFLEIEYSDRVAEDSDKEPIRQLADSALAAYSASHIFRAFEIVEAVPQKRLAAQAYKDLVRRFYFEQRDLPTMLMTASAAVRFCLNEAQKLPPTNPEGARQLREAAKAISYNGGANAWPGWGDEGISAGPTAIAIGLELARLSFDLVRQLGLGPNQLGNGHWLIGAHLLAQSRRTEAQEVFAKAAGEFAKGESRVGALMAEGYAALAASLTETANAEATAHYVDALRCLREEGSEEALAYATQIETAKTVFSQPR